MHVASIISAVAIFHS